MPCELPRKSLSVRVLSFIAILCAMLLFIPRAFAADGTQSNGITWHKGPYVAQLGTIAQIQVPEGYAFADAAGTRRFMELTQNPASGNELGVIISLPKKTEAGKANASAAGSNNNEQAQDSDFWFLLFTFEDIGYVRDDEKGSLDANKILKTLQDGTEEANQERRRRGWAPFHIVSWQTPPFYDSATNNLTWATVGQGDDPKQGTTINYETRILGRRGAMSVDLVIDSAHLNDDLPAARGILAGFSYLPGSRYAEFVKGDKVAKYGLTALIAGGVAAAAIKTGLLTKLLAMLAAFWKVILAGFVAAGAAIKRFFQNLKSKITGERPATEIAEDREKIEASVMSPDHEPR